MYLLPRGPVIWVKPSGVGGGSTLLFRGFLVFGGIEVWKFEPNTELWTWHEILTCEGLEKGLKFLSMKMMAYQNTIWSYWHCRYVATRDFVDCLLPFALTSVVPPLALDINILQCPTTKPFWPTFARVSTPWMLLCSKACRRVALQKCWQRKKVKWWVRNNKQQLNYNKKKILIWSKKKETFFSKTIRNREITTKLWTNKWVLSVFETWEIWRLNSWEREREREKMNQ